MTLNVSNFDSLVDKKIESYEKYTDEYINIMSTVESLLNTNLDVPQSSEILLNNIYKLKDFLMCNEITKSDVTSDICPLSDVLSNVLCSDTFLDINAKKSCLIILQYISLADLKEYDIFYSQNFLFSLFKLIDKGDDSSFLLKDIYKLLSNLFLDRDIAKKVIEQLFTNSFIHFLHDQINSTNSQIRINILLKLYRNYTQAFFEKFSNFNECIDAFLPIINIIIDKNILDNLNKQSIYVIEILMELINDEHFQQEILANNLIGEQIEKLFFMLYNNFNKGSVIIMFLINLIECGYIFKKSIDKTVEHLTCLIRSDSFFIESVINLLLILFKKYSCDGESFVSQIYEILIDIFPNVTYDSKLLIMKLFIKIIDRNIYIKDLFVLFPEYKEILNNILKNLSSMDVESVKKFLSKYLYRWISISKLNSTNNLGTITRSLSDSKLTDMLDELTSSGDDSLCGIFEEIAKNLNV